MNYECRNCGATVSERYIRVFSTDGEGVDACPRCPDRLRTNGKVRDARGDRLSARAVREEADVDG